MKKGVTIGMSVFSLAIVCIFMSGFSSNLSAADTVNLTYTNFWPPTHIQSQLAENWGKEVEKRTEGRVKVQYFPGSTLTKPNQTYDSVMQGIADIGMSALAYSRGRFPLMAAADLPFGYSSGECATSVANDLYNKFKPKEFDDVKVLYLHAHGPGFIHTAKNKPVHKLEDLKGLKIRTQGTSAELASALGATPVTMPMPESYEALQKGVVDGSAHPMEADKGWRLAEVTGNVVTAYPAGYTTTFYAVMNKAKWDSIDPKDQKIIDEISAEWIPRHGAAWDDSDMAGIRYFLQQGNTVNGLDDKESKRWGDAVAPVIDSYIKQLSEKGIDGKAVVDTIRESMKKFQ